MRPSLSAALRLPLLLITACAGFYPMAAQRPTADSDAMPAEARRFGPETPVFKIEPYGATVYARRPENISTMRGDAVVSDKEISDMAVSPAGASMFVIFTDKKGRTSAELFATGVKNKSIEKYNHKKLGRPLNAVFSPDARTLYVATDTAIRILNPRTLRPVGSIDNPIVTPRKMAASSNGYYLALMGDTDVAIYNLEERRLRRSLDLDAEVVDIAFSPDASEMAVLTADGLVSLFDTRGFNLRKTVDADGQGVAAAYNLDGKYLAVAVQPDRIGVFNLVKGAGEQEFISPEQGLTDVVVVPDAARETVLLYSSLGALRGSRVAGLKPFYAKLVAEEVDLKMAEWMKMMPGESDDAYRARVSDENRARQRRLFEDELSTNLAGDLLSGAGMSIGLYDRANQRVALSFETMPDIYLPVPEADAVNFTDSSALRPVEVRYGLLPDDTFEIIYAKFYNGIDGKTYTYDNTERRAIEMMMPEEAVSIEVMQQQRMEEIRLQEIREQVVEEARNNHVITNHTDITVDSRIDTDYDANGERRLNYVVNFTYEVEPDFSAEEDFGPGRYLIEESGAASSMVSIVAQALEGDFARYLKEGKKIKVRLCGTADAMPIVRTIPYDGVYGTFEEEPLMVNGELTTVTIDPAKGISENEQLAFLRALGVENYLERNVEELKKTDRDYTYSINVSEDKGSAHRRITAEFTFVDAF